MGLPEIVSSCLVSLGSFSIYETGASRFHYLVESLSMLDHYHFRVAQQEAKKKRKKLELALPPKAGQKAYT